MVCSHCLDWPHAGQLHYDGRVNHPSAFSSCLQNVVILGTGSFALEAMEAAGRNNAKHITLVSRPRKRWAESCVSWCLAASRTPVVGV